MYVDEPAPGHLLRWRRLNELYAEFRCENGPRQQCGAGEHQALQEIAQWIHVRFVGSGYLVAAAVHD